MKFTAQKSGPVAVNDGTLVLRIVEGTEYDLDKAHVETLKEHGFVASDKPKAAHPVTENKMVHPVDDNKLKLKPKS